MTETVKKVNQTGAFAQGYRLRKIGFTEETEGEIKPPRTDFTLACHAAAE